MCRAREQTLAIRRTVFKLQGLPEMEAREWLAFAKLSRNVHNYSTAADAALHAEMLGSAGARLEQAKLLMAAGQVRTFEMCIYNFLRCWILGLEGLLRCAEFYDFL